MAEYTQAIDSQIAQTLGLRGFVSAEMLAGIDETEAVDMLRRYAELHAGQRLHFDGSQLKALTTHSSGPPDAAVPRRGMTWRHWAAGGVLGVSLVALLVMSFGNAGAARSTSWPAAPDGRIAFFYFGTST